VGSRYYEIINPSDKVLLIADESDELLVAIAVLMLGEGKAGVRRDDDEDVLPLMLFGGFEQWLAAEGLTSDTFGETLKANRIKIADILETVFYGSMREAKALDLALADLPREQMLAARARYNDEKRSSLNDWGAACLSTAKNLRAMAAKEAKTEKARPSRGR
jgi:hypothetical protein